jgi:hypothetical protein
MAENGTGPGPTGKEFVPRPSWVQPKPPPRKPGSKSWRQRLTPWAVVAAVVTAVVGLVLVGRTRGADRRIDSYIVAKGLHANGQDEEALATIGRALQTTHHPGERERFVALQQEIRLAPRLQVMTQLVDRGQCAAALPLLEALAREQPGNRAATEQLARCRGAGAMGASAAPSPAAEAPRDAPKPVVGGVAPPVAVAAPTGVAAAPAVAPLPPAPKHAPSHAAPRKHRATRALPEPPRAVAEKAVAEKAPAEKAPAEKAPAEKAPDDDARVVVHCSEPSSVFVDGQATGRTTPATVRVPAGHHLIEVRSVRDLSLRTSRWVLTQSRASIRLDLRLGAGGATKRGIDADNPYGAK